MKSSPSFAAASLLTAVSQYSLKSDACLAEVTCALALHARFSPYMLKNTQLNQARIATVRWPGAGRDRRWRTP